MSRNKKILFIALGAVVLVLIVVGSIVHSRSDVTAVTTAKAGREDLIATVSGTGQIKPKTYVNVGATSFGRITHLFVKEGDHVKKGDVLATVENVQPESTVSAQPAAIAASKTDVTLLHRRREHRRSQRRRGQGRPRAEDARLQPRQGALPGPAHRQAGLRRQGRSL